MLGALGRIEPTDFSHVENAPLAALAPTDRPTHVPVAIGTNWYTGFDTPELGADGRWRLPTSNLGTVRGGHCTCLEPAPQPGEPGEELDTAFYHLFYNQGTEGACEGFGHARVLTLLYRKTFDGFWLYDDARRLEGTYPDGEGTQNKAVCEALLKWGAHLEEGQEAHREPWRPGTPTISIASYRWATTADEILSTLGWTSGSEIPLLNSWGDNYPERVYLSPETLERLMREGGEADVITEK